MKRLAIVLLALLILSPVLMPSSSARAAGGERVLLLYDSLAAGTEKAGNIAELQRLLAAYSAEVTLLGLDEYQAGQMNAYSRVITVMNTGEIDSIKPEYAEDVAAFHGKLLHIGYHAPDVLREAMSLKTEVYPGTRASLSIGGIDGLDLNAADMPYIVSFRGVRSFGSLSFEDGGVEAPFAVSEGSYTYVPYFQGRAGLLGMSYVLRDWFGATAAPHTYLVLREIYPFSDLELLEETAERLYDSGIPFVASVRPVFGNHDFPAMERYAEALRMVQSYNGSILINAPAVRPPINSSDRTLHGKMSTFIDVLAGADIAPLGIAAENYWTYDKEYATAGMGFFDSAVLFPDEQVFYMEQTNVSRAFASSVYTMNLEELSALPHAGKARPQLPLDTAVTLELPQTEAELEAMLQRLQESWIDFADFRQGIHRVETENNTISSSGGVITLNGAALNVGYSPQAIDGNYQYQEDQKVSFARLFSVQSTFFIVVIIAALLLFGGLLLIGRRLYLKKYLK
ncbi:hypothetical protein [Paenibacillus tepidiphilus]|uniref:hypothetical protein n=1 Tax=Paenibacillus tepidiphilus TaxID=2608683 RepID=UPI00123B5384|nr:hypothetical protein [Paenibacillus tepidiphilus]